jgi:hypothetical protein
MKSQIAYIALVRLFYLRRCARIGKLQRRARRVRRKMAARGVRKMGGGEAQAGGAAPFLDYIKI